MGDLLPCPFCGSTSIGEPIRRRPLQVACIDCGSEGPEALTHDDARDRWNARAPSPRLADALGLLAEALAAVEDTKMTALADEIRAFLEAPNV